MFGHANESRFGRHCRCTQGRMNPTNSNATHDKEPDIYQSIDRSKIRNSSKQTRFRHTFKKNSV
jgi:hypothetical protein